MNYLIRYRTLPNSVDKENRIEKLFNESFEEVDNPQDIIVLCLNEVSHWIPVSKYTFELRVKIEDLIKFAI